MFKKMNQNTMDLTKTELLNLNVIFLKQEKFIWDELAGAKKIKSETAKVLKLQSIQK